MNGSGRIIAMLGPTNTGKTHMAVERMLSFPTGIIGLPLRLLAREVFDRIRERVGEAKVALITGEEKIRPPEARYFVCTVEAMPSDIRADFVAIDEIQLAADFERGHVFTDRILHARGLSETWLLGAATMRPLLKNLLPNVSFRERPRLSRLSYAGSRKITRLPPRTAIVAFSAETVYATAELIRRQKGGAAVVMGALSPRTRNAQVALYQSGEVDYLVATDAIGMGLNMDVDHVAFAATRKFDGFHFRELTVAEMGQIAGRAGRHLNDGTFGVTASVRPLDADVVEALEEHRFPPVKVAQWRNRNLSFASVDRLLASLNALPNREGLARARRTSDIAALETLSRHEDVMRVADTPDMVRLLWDVCQIPDYRNITGGDHAALVGRIFRFLSGPEGVIDEDWLAAQVARCARFDGGIDALSQRIAHIRTWTFVANRGSWLKDARWWREETRKIEDKLSDALHERLTRRFIDRKTSVLLKRLREREELMASVDDDGAVRVEDEYVGRVEGLRFIADGETGTGAHEKAWNAAARKALAQELAGRAQSLAAAPDTDFELTARGGIVWHGAEVGRLVPGPDILKPDVKLLADEVLEAADRDAVLFRLKKFVSRHVENLLEPLVRLRDDEEITGVARGLAYRLVEGLGIVPRPEVAADVRQMDQETRGLLRRHGVRFGAFHIFVPALLKPAPAQLRVLLWGLQKEKEGTVTVADLPEPPGQGLTSVEKDPGWPEGFCQVCGYMDCGPRVVRVDMLERLGDMIRERVFWKPRFDGEERPAGSVEGGGFVVIPDMMSLVGCSGDDFSAVLKALGYRAEKRPVRGTGMEADAASGDGGRDGNEAAADADAAPDGSGGAGSAEAMADGAEAAAEDGERIGEEASGSDAAAEPEAKAASSGDGAPEEKAAEPEFIEVWWPQGTGPFRQRRQRSAKGGRSGGRAGGKPSRGKGRQAHGGKRPEGAKKNGKGGRGPRRGRAPDADSPFAVLQKLKMDMEKKS